MAPERIWLGTRKLVKRDVVASREPADAGLGQIRPALSGCRAPGARGVGGLRRCASIAFSPPPGGSPQRASNAIAISMRNSG